jgi:hypothetical protein
MYKSSPENDTKDDDTSDSGSDDQAGYRGRVGNSSTASAAMSISRGIYGSVVGVSSASAGSGSAASSKESVRAFADRCRFIPMRLTEGQSRTGSYAISNATTATFRCLFIFFNSSWSIVDRTIRLIPNFHPSTHPHYQPTTTNYPCLSTY